MAQLLDKSNKHSSSPKVKQYYNFQEMMSNDSQIEFDQGLKELIELDEVLK